MKIALALAGILALPASAQDAAFWGATGCVLVPVEGEAWVADQGNVSAAPASFRVAVAIRTGWAMVAPALGPCVA